MQHDVQSFPLSAKQIAQAPARGETLSHCQQPACAGLPNTDPYVFLLLFWLLLLFALRLSPGPAVSSALLFMGLDTLMQYYRIAELGRGLWRSSTPTQLEKDLQGRVQSGFEHL